MDTRKALDKAVQLAGIASDWNLDEVEIDGEMVSIYALREEFEVALKALEAPAMEVVPDGYYGDLSIEDDGKVVGFYFDDELGYASADLPDGMVIMRPAANTNDSD